MERRGGRTRAGFLAAGLAAAVLLGGCAQRAEEPATGQIFAMDTIMSMDVYGDGGEEALAQAEETIYRLEDLWAVTDENSEIWALNHSGGAWVDLSQETVDLLAQALELCALTDGGPGPDRLLGGAGLGVHHRGVPGALPGGAGRPDPAH